MGQLEGLSTGVGDCPIIEFNIPFTNKTLQELIDLHPFMLPENPGDPNRIIHQHTTSLGGERFAETNILAPWINEQDEEMIDKAGLKRWRVDLSRYSTSDLDTGELNRSKGHINAEYQIEIAQVLSGKVRLFMQDPNNLSAAYYVDAGYRNCVLIPPGWYHSTHVLDGPAIVIDLVNREGFHDWREKAYGQFRAAYTFFRKNNGEAAMFPNPEYTKLPILLNINPTPFLLLSDFDNSIYSLVHHAEPEMLNKLARDILSANISSNLIRPVQFQDKAPVSHLPLIA